MPERGASERPRRPVTDAENVGLFDADVIFSTLVDEFESGYSRLSTLPFEVIEQIFNHVSPFVSKSLECVNTRGVFASLVGKVDFPAFGGIKVTKMPILPSDPSSIPPILEPVMCLNFFNF